MGYGKTVSATRLKRESVLLSTEKLALNLVGTCLCYSESVFIGFLYILCTDMEYHQHSYIFILSNSHQVRQNQSANHHWWHKNWAWKQGQYVPLPPLCVDTN